ncbi:MAG: hypothetical protein ABJD97_05830 [Betaproteobacteria bacterium]
MGRFNIEGRWYDADDYKSARALHQQWKAGASGAAEPPPIAAVTPPPVVKAKPVPGPKPAALRAASMPVVAAVVAPVVVAPALGGIASELKLYRGDERAADVIARDGFELWGDAVAGVSAAGGIAEFILHKLYLAYSNERDIERYIVTAKDRARPTISTSRNEGCGGYDSGNIYRIEYTASELQEYAFDDVMRAYSPAATGTKFPNFKLYMDRPDIKAARQIALDLNIATQEVVYFRHLPGSKITQYKPKGGASFVAMPAAAAKPKLW